MQLVQVGQPLRGAAVASSIDNLFASRLYSDIRVDAEADGNGVAIRFVTSARVFVGHVDARGDFSNPPSRGVILSNAQMPLGSPFNPDDVETAKRNILQTMRDNGLQEATVTSATVLDPELHQMTVRFLVNAGKRARYDTPVIHGETKLPDSTIIRATGWRIPLVHRWRLVTQALTDKGITGITKRYAKQERLTTSVNLDSMEYEKDKGRLRPTLTINAGPRIDIKAVEAKLSKKKLQAMVPVYQESTIDNDLLNEGARNIHNYFQARGYPDVDVTFKLDAPQNDREQITYFIALGPRRRLVHIDVLGAEYFQPETIHERMFLQTKSLLLRYGRYSETFRSQDEESIASLYRSNGFRDARVTSSVQTGYKGKEDDLAVTFHVYPGEQWKVAHLRIEGSVRLDLDPIRDQFYSIEDQPFADVNVQSDRNRILEYYYEHGFLQASFRYQIQPGEKPATVDLTYSITEGPQDFVRKVIISGLENTRPSLVTRKIKLREGEPVSIAKINEFSRQLTDLGIFANVSSALQDQGGSNRYKYVLYDFDEAARYSFNIGFGLQVGQFGRTTNNVSNAGGSKGLSPIVSFDVNRINFLGRGQTVSLQTRFSSLEQLASINYIVPRFLGSLNRTVTFSLLYNTTQNVQTFASRREQASVQTSQRFNRASTLLWRFDYRRVSVSSVEIPSLLIPTLLQPVRIGIMSVGYIQDHRDSPADAHRGFWNTADIGLAGNFFGSQRSFVRALLRNATYTPLPHGMVLARQTQLGGIIPFNISQGTTSFESIPLPERFFGGGSVSMRGFGDNQAGPRDIALSQEISGPPSTNPVTGGPNLPTGFPIGGDALFFNNVELRFPLLGQNINGVLFEDMGNIYTRFSDISLGYRQSSYTNFNYAVQAPGFGIRYKTPLGPIRIDLSYVLNPTRYQGFSSGETTQDLLNCKEIGTTPECTPGPQRLSRFNFFFSIGQAF
jgi:outer membrane protein insertion porin family